jgi:hypothetical protein
MPAFRSAANLTFSGSRSNDGTDYPSIEDTAIGKSPSRWVYPQKARIGADVGCSVARVRTRVRDKNHPEQVIRLSRVISTYSFDCLADPFSLQWTITGR